MPLDPFVTPNPSYQYEVHITAHYSSPIEISGFLEITPSEYGYIWDPVTQTDDFSPAINTMQQLVDDLQCLQGKGWTLRIQEVGHWSRDFEPTPED